MTSGQPDDVKRQVAAHWDRRAPGFDEDFGHSIRTPAERAAWGNRTRGHLDDARAQAATLPVFPGARMIAVDAAGYYVRPGPRVVDGIEALAAVLHPDAGLPARRAIAAELDRG